MEKKKYIKAFNLIEEFENHLTTIIGNRFGKRSFIECILDVNDKEVRFKFKDGCSEDSNYYSLSWEEIENEQI